MTSSSSLLRRMPLLGALCLASTLAWSQTTYDFSKVDMNDVNVDSIQLRIIGLQRSSGIDSLYNLIAYKQAGENDGRKNFAFFIGYMSSRSSLDNMNRDLAALGLSPISEQFGGVPWGFDVRGKRLLFSYIFAPGIKNTVSNADYTVETERTSLALSFGYDVLNFKRLHLYPQLALDLQDFEIAARRNAASADITSINELILNPAGSTASKGALTLSYSAEIDFNIVAKDDNGLMIGFRYGYSMPLTNRMYKIDGVPSSFDTPGDSIWTSFYSIVLKLYVVR